MLPEAASLSDESLASLKLLLEGEWETQFIPDAQRQPFRECIEALEHDPAKLLLIKEIEDLRKSKAPSQQALRAVAAREESLKSVKEMNDYLRASDGWEKVKEVQTEAAELLHAHRMLTLSAIEGIMKWRGQMQEAFNLPPHNFPFMWEGENYLLKLRDDLDFLKQSEYAKVMNFGEEPDPLLVYPSVPAGKAEKNRKRDANYFLSEGQAIVPLPSTITGRVKEAEDYVRKEYDWIRFLEENDPKRLANFYGPDLADKFIDEIIGEYVSELGEEVRKEKEDAEKLRIREIENIDLAEKIYLELVDSIAMDVEGLANDEYLAAVAAMEAKKLQKLSEDDKLAKLIYKSLKDQLIDVLLIEISEETKALLEQEEQDEKSVYERGNILEEMGLDFASTEAFSDLSGVMWIPIGLSEEFIEEALEEYYRFIPSAIKEVLPDIPSLLVEVTKAIDTRWYWAIRNKKIFALLIFSIDCYSKSGRKLIVHHISSLYWKAYPAIIDSATQHMWKIDLCDETRIGMIAKLGNDLSPDIKKVLNISKYKWKAHHTETRYDIIIFGRAKPNTTELPAFIPFKLRAFCSLRASNSPCEENQSICAEMGQIGNRQIFLNSLLGLIGRLEKAEIKISSVVKTPLQKEVSDILNLMNQTQSFSFPNMKGVTTTNQGELDEFCRDNSVGVTPLKGLRASISLLEVNFRWISCTNTVESIRGQGYKYMRFRSKDIVCTRLHDILVVRVPTEMPNISAFFIENSMIKQEINNNLTNKLDMFCLTEDLLRKGAKEDINEVWVPCFRKEARWNVPWIQGYELVRQREELYPSYITECFEETTLGIDQQILTEGLLVFSKKKGPVLMHDFIFGLMYTKGDKIIDIPLFCCLVEQEKDWIRSL